MKHFFELFSLELRRAWWIIKNKPASFLFGNIVLMAILYVYLKLGGALSPSLTSFSIANRSVAIYSCWIIYMTTIGTVMAEALEKQNGVLVNLYLTRYNLATIFLIRIIASTFTLVLTLAYVVGPVAAYFGLPLRFDSMSLIGLTSLWVGSAGLAMLAVLSAMFLENVWYALAGAYFYFGTLMGVAQQSELNQWPILYIVPLLPQISLAKSNQGVASFTPSYMEILLALLNSLIVLAVGCYVFNKFSPKNGDQ